MFSNFSLIELLVVGAIALIVIGPKDLPKMMRSAGKLMGQARGMARQFQDSMNEAAREADLQELNDARKMLSPKSPMNALTNSLNETLDVDGDAKPQERRPLKKMSSKEMQAFADDAGFGKRANDAENAENADHPVGATKADAASNAPKIDKKIETPSGAEFEDAPVQDAKTG